MRMSLFHNRQENNHLRKILRNSLTKPEVILWYYLKNSGLGYKFRRQHGIGRYIVDFYCPRLKLVIELDGGQHFTEEGLAYDKERDAFIRSLGIEIVRIPNSEILYNKAGTLEILKKVLECWGRLFDHLPSR